MHLDVCICDLRAAEEVRPCLLDELRQLLDLGLELLLYHLQIGERQNFLAW